MHVRPALRPPPLLAAVTLAVTVAGTNSCVPLDEPIDEPVNEASDEASDEASASYAVASGALQTTPDWTAEGDQFAAHLGASVRLAGDVNGDGFDDVIVGAPYYDNGQYSEGRALVYHGSATGLSSSPSWTAESDRSRSLFGDSVSGAGDVNGDGFDDIIVGAYYYENGEDREGAAFVYLGSSTGLSQSPSWMVESDVEDTSFGDVVSGAGDINGDGFDDVLVGALNYDTSEPDVGAVFLYTGSSSGLSVSPTWTVVGSAVVGRLGSAISSAGDVNADGFDDVVIGTPEFHSNSQQLGKVEVYLGSASGLPSNASWSAQGAQTQSQSQYGYSPRLGGEVSTAGDVNGDGFDDILVTYIGHDTSGYDAGSVYVFHGNATGVSSTAQWFVEGTQTEQHLGIPSAAGDVNDDGFDDVIIGAPSYDNTSNDAGRVVVYYGSPTGLASSSNWSIEGSQLNEKLGISVSTAGDVNADGVDDIIYGSFNYTNDLDGEGRSVVYHGVPNLHAPEPVDDAATLVEDTSTTIDVLANDSDPDGHSLSVVLVRTSNHASATINADGTIGYTPAAHFYGDDTFEYTVEDTSGLRATAAVTVTVSPVYDDPYISTTPPPTATEEALYTYNAGTLEQDSNALTWTVGAQDDCGGVIDAAGTYTFTPQGPIPPADCLLHIEVCDPSLCDDQVATVTIQTVNSRPVALDDNAATVEDTAVTFDVLSNDNDEDGDPLSIYLGLASHGGAVLNADNSITYTPSPDYNGNDAFQYRITDPSGASVRATVWISVSPVEDAPIFEPSSPVDGQVLTVDEGSMLLFRLEAYDAEYDPVTYSITPLPAGANFSTSSGLFDWIPDWRDVGTYAWTLTAADATGSDVHHITVEVVSVDSDADGLSNTWEDDYGLHDRRTDSDSDYIADGDEATQSDAGPVDSDADGVSDALDDDSDNDGVVDEDEAGDRDPGTPPVDTDADGVADFLDSDSDGDGSDDSSDNCRLVVNSAQLDLDADGIGDPCDNDTDGDSFEDSQDNCPAQANQPQADIDADGEGDVCDSDDDGDGHPDDEDNCPLDDNSAQTDTDADGEGDLCDYDDDDDGVGDRYDNCPLTSNDQQTDTDNDDLGDPCDDDDDDDGVDDAQDNCPEVANSEQVDTDSDGAGDGCDTDDDDDEQPDEQDNCPQVKNSDQLDTDADGQGDGCDEDDDDDGVADAQDNCPMAPNADQDDTDGDGVGDRCDDSDDRPSDAGSDAGRADAGSSDDTGSDNTGSDDAGQNDTDNSNAANPPETTELESGCGCSSTSAPSNATSLLLVICALAAMRLRRRWSRRLRRR